MISFSLRCFLTIAAFLVSTTGLMERSVNPVIIMPPLPGCEPCGQLCRYAALQDIPLDCRDICKRKTSPTKYSEDKVCPPGEYFDSVIQGCDLCKQQCPFAAFQNIPSVCVDICQSTTTTRPHGGQDRTLQLTDVDFLLIALGSAIIAVSVLALGILFIKNKKKSGTQCCLKTKLKYPQQETATQAEQPEDHNLLTGSTV